MDQFLSLNFTVIALISSFFGALANLLARVLLKDINTKDILGINFLTMAATLIIFSPWFYFFEATRVTIGLVVLIALIDTLANYFYFKTFEKTEAGVASPILSLAPAFTFILSLLVLHDQVSIFALMLCLAIIAMVVLFSVDFKNLGNFKQATLYPAIISSVLFGISAIPAKYLLSNLHAINSLTLYMFRAALIAIFALLFFNFTLKNITVKQYRTIFFRGLLVIAQWSLLYWALTKGSAGVAVTLANVTPIFVFILGAVLLRERITLKKALASALILLLSLML